MGTVIGKKEARVVFYRSAPPRTGKQGTLKKDGAFLQIGNVASYGTPDGHSSKTDDKGRPVEISWWGNLHVKEARWLSFTVIRVVRPHASKTERDPRISWFVWIGDEQEAIAEVALGYTLRFGQEHGYRFDKQGLLWDQPLLQTPEQLERWSSLVASAYNQLLLARDLVEVELRPWESKHRPLTLRTVA